MSALEHTEDIDGQDRSGRVRVPLSRDESWKRLAACHGQQRLFFPHRSERPQAKARREARARRICLACPVLAICREYARANREFGFWAGENEDDRRTCGGPPTEHAS